VCVCVCERERERERESWKADAFIYCSSLPCGEISRGRSVGRSWTDWDSSANLESQRCSENERLLNSSSPAQSQYLVYNPALFSDSVGRTFRRRILDISSTTPRTLLSVCLSVKSGCFVWIAERMEVIFGAAIRLCLYYITSLEEKTGYHRK